MKSMSAVEPRVSGQDGVVLFIALIVLVAMSLAGIALMRSVDTATMVTGNLAMKQSTIQSSNAAVIPAANWLSANSAGTGLYNSAPSSGYFSAAPMIEPNWFDEATWTGQSATVNSGAADAAGNKIRYMIHRLCTEPDTEPGGNGPSGAFNLCAQYFPTDTISGGSKSVGSFKFYGRPEIFYRMTVRVDGPRNTVTITQVNLQVPR